MLIADQGLQIAGRKETVLRLHGDWRGVQVDHGRVHEGIAKLLFDGQNMRPADKHVGVQRMPKQVGMDAFVDARPLGHGADQFTEVLLPVRVAGQTDADITIRLITDSGNVGIVTALPSPPTRFLSYRHQEAPLC